jgi:hypothetical protein
MRTMDEEIARHLQQAAESGELSRIEGYGKPLPQDAGWEATPEELRMPFKILKNAGFVPPEVEMFHERAALTAALHTCQVDSERLVLQGKLSALQQKLAVRMEALRATGNL